MPCELCGENENKLLYASDKKAKKTGSYRISEAVMDKPERIIQCKSCDLVYADKEESHGALIYDYETMEDTEYVREEKGRRLQARVVLRRLCKQKRRGRLLDVGCGPGIFVDEANKQGWAAHGVDLSYWAQEYGRENYDVSIHNGTLEEAGFEENSFDAVTLLDVIEHVQHPSETLNEVRRVLKPGGILYISTPNINSFLSRFLKQKWWSIQRYHLFYFSKKTLNHLLSKAGFQVVQYAQYPRIFSLRYWAERLKGYPAVIRKPMEFLAKKSPDKTLRLDLYDQLDLIAKKPQTMDEIPKGPQERKPLTEPKPKVIAVLPAYNASKTLRKTVADISRQYVDEIILVDDCSSDDTVDIAQRLGLTVFRHEKNQGYGGNQKTCYQKAIEKGADIVVMVHPDYQYDPTLIPAMIDPIRRGEADAVFGSRMMKGGALEGGMPLWKHNANILLTAFENTMLGTYLTEYHSGFRAYSTKMLKRIHFTKNSDGFIFDTEIIVQILATGHRIEEIPIRTRYFDAASSIRLWPSILYGLGIICTMLRTYLHHHELWHNPNLDLK